MITLMAINLIQNAVVISFIILIIILPFTFSSWLLSLLLLSLLLILLLLLFLSYMGLINLVKLLMIALLLALLLIYVTLVTMNMIEILHDFHRVCSHSVLTINWVFQYTFEETLKSGSQIFHEKSTRFGWIFKIIV